MCTGPPLASPLPSSPRVKLPVVIVRRSRPIGLDIGSSRVRAVALQRTWSGWILVAAAARALPLDASPDAADSHAADLVLAIREVLDALRVQRQAVVAALSGHVFVKRLSLPSMSARELAAAMPWQAQEHVPFDLAEVRIDYVVLEPDAGAIASTVDVLLVAARRDRVAERTALVEETGRSVAAIDVEAFALVNAYRMNYPERADPLAALVHIGRSATIVCLMAGSQLVFTRAISIGSRLYTDALERDLALDATAAERAIQGDLPEGVRDDDVTARVRQVSRQLVLEIRRTTDRHPAGPEGGVRRIVLSGGAWASEGLADALSGEFGAPVDVFDPFRRLSRPDRFGNLPADGPAYAVAVGLAMRRRGDRR